MSAHHLLKTDALRRLEGSSWAIIQRLRIAKTVMDAIRIYTNRPDLLPSHARGLVFSEEKLANIEIFNAFHLRVNDLIGKQLRNELLSIQDRKFYALNTLRHCRGHLPGTCIALENYLNDAPNPFSIQPSPDRKSG